VRPRRATTAVALILLLAACTAERSDVGAGSSPRSQAPVSNVSPPDDRTFVRTCASRVIGDLGDDWRNSSVVVGVWCWPMPGSQPLKVARGRIELPTPRFSAACSAN